MIQSVYSVRDKVSGQYGQPIFEINEATAKRSFGIACKSGSSLLSSAPADFELHYIGTFDTDAGVIMSVPDQIIARGSDYAEV